MATGWAPIVNIQRGVKQLYQWLLESHGLPPMRAEPMGAFDAILAH
jgi:hypothetical protein